MARSLTEQALARQSLPPQYRIEIISDRKAKRLCAASLGYLVEGEEGGSDPLFASRATSLTFYLGIGGLGCIWC